MNYSRDSSLVDMSKLTERELLVLLYDKLDRLESGFKKTDTDVESLKDRVTKLEARLYTISGIAVFISGAIALMLNFYRTFK